MKDVSDKEDYTIPLKKGTRWEKFDGDELRMIAYGLSQIYDNSPKDLVNKLLKELNPICFPGLCKSKD